MKKRTRRPKRKADDSDEPAVVLTGKDKFKIDTFYVIIDAIVADLSQRIQAYSEIDRRCSFLYRDDSNSTETTESINSFVEFYTADVNNELFNEWIQWRSFLKQLPSTETGTAVTPQKMLNIMYRYNLKDGFPNVSIALRIYLTLPVSNCSGERSFSHLKRIKSSLRSTMGQDRLANLTLLNIESEILTDLDFQDIIDSFSTLKARRKDF